MAERLQDEYNVAFKMDRLQPVDLDGNRVDKEEFTVGTVYQRENYKIRNTLTTRSRVYKLEGSMKLLDPCVWTLLRSS